MEKRFSIRIDGKWECGCHFWDSKNQSFSLFSLIALRNCVQPSSGTLCFTEATQPLICLILSKIKAQNYLNHFLATQKKLTTDTSYPPKNDKKLPWLKIVSSVTS